MPTRIAAHLYGLIREEGSEHHIRTRTRVPLPPCSPGRAAPWGRGHGRMGSPPPAVGAAPAGGGAARRGAD